MSSALIAGVTLISNVMRKRQDRFLICHELGHLMYLSHHEVNIKTGLSSNWHSHDLADHNCTMSYAFGIKSRPKLEWLVEDADEPRFCGKCILKLRGWRVAFAGLPDSH